MTSPRRFAGDVGLADAVGAIGVLQADPEASQRIAALLGFDVSTDPSTTGHGADAREIASTGEDDDAPPESPSAGTAREPDVPGDELTPWPNQLRPVGREFAPSVTRNDAQPLPPDSPTRAPLELRPLLRRHYVGRIVQSAASADAGDGDIDVDEVVEMLAARTPVTDWPVKRRLSMLRGVQLLVDIGESMGLFARDCEDLTDTFTAVVGAHLVDSLAFQGCPTAAAGNGPRWQWRPYVPPLPGTPVVILSDLNIPGCGGQDVDVDGWLRLDSILRSQGSSLLIFVPFPPLRWPARLRRHLRLIPWDRPTTPSSVVRAMSAGQR